jgi:hypothetical protein
MYDTASALLATVFMLVSCLAFPSNLKMEIKYFSETSIHFQWNTLRYNPADSTRHSHSYEKIKSYI